MMGTAKREPWPCVPVVQTSVAQVEGLGACMCIGAYLYMGAGQADKCHRGPVGTVDDTHTRCPCLSASASFWCDSTRDFPKQEEDREKQDHDGEVWVTLIFLKQRELRLFFFPNESLRRGLV